ncbi:MAG: hypothetical protein J5726_05805 [Treponema sp.]|nr:hypothetical protein [Treponema sp.]
MSVKRIIFGLFILVCGFSLFAQSLPDGYGGVHLGMSLDETKKQLLKNSDFGYSGDRDVSLLPGQGRTLIETNASGGRGSPYLTQCYFQFYNEQLYIITININNQKTDYYTMYTTLSEKYGKPVSLDPQMAVWENDSIIIQLERPLSVKYIDKETFDMLKTAATVQKSFEEQNLQSFLDEF